jgi:hypothetical protein
MTIFENRTETLREETSGVKVIRHHKRAGKIKNAARNLSR